MSTQQIQNTELSPELTQPVLPKPLPKRKTYRPQAMMSKQMEPQHLPKITVRTPIDNRNQKANLIQHCRKKNRLIQSVQHSLRQQQTPIKKSQFRMPVKTHQRSVSKRYRTQQDTQINQLDSSFISQVLSQQHQLPRLSAKPSAKKRRAPEINDNLHIMIGSIPRSSKLRTYQSLEPLAKYLCKSNPFFSKLKNSSTRHIMHHLNFNFYAQNQKIVFDQRAGVMIILKGLVLLQNKSKQYKIQLSAGDTVGEETIFQKTLYSSQQRIHFLLYTVVGCLTMSALESIQSVMVRERRTKEFNLIMTLLKRNMLTKKALRQG